MLFILVSGYCLLPQTVMAEKYIHTVKKGDTLWGICEQYYGNPELWPKLWEMNSFITNPHLLNPGDIITLFEDKEEKQPEKVEVASEKEPEPIVKPEPKIMGIGLGDITNPDIIGFYSNEKIAPWGTIFATKNNQIIFGKGDTVYIIFEENKNISAGDIFTIGRSSSPIKHPLKKKETGFLFNPSGKLVIEKPAGTGYTNEKFYKKDNVYQAKVINSYEPIYKNDIVIPYQSVSNCVLPIPNKKDILANIFAARGDQALIHPYTIVYIDRGEKDGIIKGNIFEILKENIVKDPKPGEDAYLLSESKIILPDKTLGKILVIDTKPDSATAIVLSATESVSKGAYIKSISWTETPDFIATRANCPIE